MECRRRMNHRLMRPLPVSERWRPAYPTAILRGNFLDRARIYTYRQSRRNRFLCSPYTRPVDNLRWSPSEWCYCYCVRVRCAWISESPGSFLCATCTTFVRDTDHRLVHHRLRQHRPSWYVSPASPQLRRPLGSSMLYRRDHQWRSN